ncbi:hypothetical protein BDV27DRAFT_159829 [Aspergillus caelatus]|uniref:Uncharacterized protein n=1 Tax=Aspergillus caelatus TaxID=61420 RepID=A0A5N6ZZI6_9EURO|nr:uncharacterized protein BDV27DRAFT_159829 [Aspergillus caelatus]KAE8362349.1 hypothetical protein BDV27DRAFT_159829 [Aspergillus caelatus]
MTDQEAAFLNSTRAGHSQSPEVVHASRAAAPASAQPVKPPAYPAWANQDAAQPSFTPPQAQTMYNIAAIPPSINSLCHQQLQQQHYVLQVSTPQDTFGQPPMGKGYPQSQAQPHEQGLDYDSDI